MAALLTLISSAFIVVVENPVRVNWVPKKMPPKRDVSPVLQKLRDFLLGRKNVNTLRFADEVSPRTQPPPKLPEGPSAKLSANYYYTRDARGLVKPGEVLMEGETVLKLPEGGEKPTTILRRVPGKVYNWDM